MQIVIDGPKLNTETCEYCKCIFKTDEYHYRYTTKDDKYGEYIYEYPKGKEVFQENRYCVCPMCQYKIDISTNYR